MKSSSVSGRPIRFFAVVMVGWMAIRIAVVGGNMLVTSHGSMPGPAKMARAASAPITPPQFRGMTLPSDEIHASGAELIEIGFQGRSAMTAPPPAPPAARVTRYESVAPSPANDSPTAPVEASKAPPTVFINAAPALPLASAETRPSDRWQGSAWLLWRDGSAPTAGAIAAGRLGGSQAGLRIDFDLTPGLRSRTAAYARASVPMNRPASPEAAVGLFYQPARSVPISMAAERRIALGDGARDASALMVVGGFGPTPVGKRIEAEAYAQTGIVGLRTRDPFVDGKLSLSSPVGNPFVRFGVSVSGGAQPRVERLDVGPELQVRLPLTPVAARLGIEWRERVAGQAAPASGLAVTLGSYF